MIRLTSAARARTARTFSAIVALSLGVVSASALTAHDDPPTTRIAFDAKPGTERTKSFVLEQQLTLQSLQIETDGIAQSIQRPLELSSKLEIRTRDALRAVDGGKPSLFARNFDAFGLHVDVRAQGTDGKPLTETVEATSVLGGTSVLFTWVPKSGVFGRCYEGREAIEEYLPKLRGEFDLRAYLPERAVKPGDEWTVEPARLVDLLSPFGDMPLRFTKNSDVVPPRSLALGIGGPLDALFAAENVGVAPSADSAKIAAPKGNVRVRFESLAKDGEVDTAILAIEYDVEIVRDQAMAMREWLTALEVFDGVTVPSAELRWKSAGKGRIVWDMSAGTWKKIELAGSESCTSSAEYARAGKSTRQTSQFAGTLKLDVAAKSPAAKSADAKAPK